MRLEYGVSRHWDGVWRIKWCILFGIWDKIDAAWRVKHIGHMEYETWHAYTMLDIEMVHDAYSFAFPMENMRYDTHTVSGIELLVHDDA